MKNLKHFFETPAKAVVSIVVIIAVLALAGAAGAAFAKSSLAGEKQPYPAASDAGVDDSGTAKITLEQAKEIAVSDAGEAFSDVTFTKEKLDFDDGISVYDIEFLAGNTEYEYEIKEDTGAIYSKSKETFTDRQSEQPQDGQAADASSQIPQDAGQAQQNDGALPDSGMSGSASDNASFDIGTEQAKEIAAGHAGFSVSDVQFTKAKLDREHGAMVYEIEFYKDGVEYEYEINAATGDIIEYDHDWDDIGSADRHGLPVHASCGRSVHEEEHCWR